MQYVGCMYLSEKLHVIIVEWLIIQNKNPAIQPQQDNIAKGFGSLEHWIVPESIGGDEFTDRELGEGNEEPTPNLMSS